MNQSQKQIDFVIERITSYIEEVLNERETRIGLSIALTDSNGIIWAGGFGFTDHTRKERVTPSTLFSSQSMGKCFTATTFLILATKGLIKLDDSILKHYPKFKINTRFGDPEEEIQKITFRRMLSHRAGFTHEAIIGNNYDYTPCSFEDHIRSIGEGWLKSQVGSELSYSNLGYDLTGYVMGIIMNKSFQKVMETELFHPLEITQATYDVLTALNKSFARGYDGKYAYPVVQIPMLGAGGLFVSVLDVCKLISFHLKSGRIGNRQLIDPTLLEEMYKPQFLEKKEFGYGLGLYSVEKIGNVKAYGHAGGGYGYQTNMLWLPEYDIGVVILSNNMKKSRVGSIALKALKLFVNNMQKVDIQSVFPNLKPPDIKCSTTISPELLRRLEGTYCADANLASHLLRISYENKKLFVYYMDGNKFELCPQNSIEFISQSQVQYSFEINKDTHATAVKIDNNIFPYTAKYNDSSNDKFGPNRSEWQEYVGIYIYEEESRPNYLALDVNNGYLYLYFRDMLKLQQYKDNIYFTADGESLIVNKGNLNYKGISAKKLEYEIQQVVQNIIQAEIKFDYHYLAVSSLVGILIYFSRVKSALDFLEELILIDKEFIGIFVNLGKHLFAVGKIKEAKMCFTKILKLDWKNAEIKDFIKSNISN